jgi:hypothetical protein
VDCRNAIFRPQGTSAVILDKKPVCLSVPSLIPPNFNITKPLQLAQSLPERLFYETVFVLCPVH